VFLVRRREVDLVRVASAACCLGAGHSPFVSAGPSGRRAAGGRSRCGRGNSGRINRHHRRADKGEVAETGASKANPTQTDDGPNTAIGELTGGTLRISQ